MPRPRTVPDDHVLDGVERVLHEKGPHELTLADVARATGLAPATLVQRFGSKRGLIVAFASRAAAQSGQAFERGAPGLGTLRQTLCTLAAALGDRRRMVNGIALLLEDVRDPELGSAAREQAEALEGEIDRQLRAAVAKGELSVDDPRDLARTVYTAYNGALIGWALRGGGTLRSAVRRAVDAVLRPYLASGRPR